MTVTLNLTDKEAEALYWFIQKQFEDYGQEGYPNVVNIHDKLDSTKARWLSSLEDGGNG